MKMSRLSMLQPWSRLTCWQEGFPVKIYHSQGSKPESLKASEVDYGESLPDSFAHYDHGTSWWKTSQACLFSQGLELYSETWPSAGTMRNGKCWRLQTLARSISEPGFIYWPTPTTVANQSSPSMAKNGAGCRKAIENPGNYKDPTWVEWLMGYPIGWTDLGG